MFLFCFSFPYTSKHLYSLFHVWSKGEKKVKKEAPLGLQGIDRVRQSSSKVKQGVSREDVTSRVDFKRAPF